ncbi:MAG: hypothetical protein QX196_07310 [Methylococcaceae bacterium]
MDRLGTTRQEPGSKNKQHDYSIKTRVKTHLIAVVINNTLWLVLAQVVGAYV